MYKKVNVFFLENISIYIYVRMYKVSILSSHHRDKMIKQAFDCYFVEFRLNSNYIKEE